MSYAASWSGRRFTVVDTGGWEPDAKGLQQAVAAQAELAMKTADAIVVVVDATVGATSTDEAVAKVLRRSKTPVILVRANKIDSERQEAEAAALWSLGLGEPHPVSAAHGRGAYDVLDKILEVLPETPREATTLGGPRRVALVGKPNVGKSSLLTSLPDPSGRWSTMLLYTTVDLVDELVELGGKTWQFIDTAGRAVKSAPRAGTNTMPGCGPVRPWMRPRWRFC